MQRRRPVMLMIMDGWGWREDAGRQRRPASSHAQLRPALGDLSACTAAHLRQGRGPAAGADGKFGGRPPQHRRRACGDAGLAAYRRRYRERRDRAAAGLAELITKIRQSGGTCHLMGLVSPGGVHSHQDHAVGLAKILSAAGVPSRAHLTDGRDTPPQSAGEDIARFIAALPPSTAVATVCGRYYAMDRDKRWERVAKAYAAMVAAEGPRFPDAPAAIADAYAQKKFDEFIVPAAVGDYAACGTATVCSASISAPTACAKSSPPCSIRVCRLRAPAHGQARLRRRNDAIQRRPRQPHGDDFPSQTLTHILGEVVADAGRTQLRMAETEKYPHVTYFLNGGREELSGEDRIMVPSPKVATYDLQPEMSAPELTDKAVAAIDSGKYDLIVLNFANPDMVGHTGSLPAAIKAVETVDPGSAASPTRSRGGGALLVTADHGNCELMRDPETGGPHTAHTTNPVPVLLIGARKRIGRRRPPRRHRADAARADGTAEAQGDDRHVAAAARTNRRRGGQGRTGQHWSRLQQHDIDQETIRQGGRRDIRAGKSGGRRRHFDAGVGAGRRRRAGARQDLRDEDNDADHPRGARSIRCGLWRGSREG